jgi:hypothetical protein
MDYTVTARVTRVVERDYNRATVEIAQWDKEKLVEVKTVWHGELALIEPQEDTRPRMWALYALRYLVNCLDYEVYGPDQPGEVKTMLELFEPKQDLRVSRIPLTSGRQ